MSDCSRNAWNPPGVSRLIIEWADENERAFDWPFVANGREVKRVTIDGKEYGDIDKLKEVNAKLCAEINELNKDGAVLCKECKFLERVEGFHFLVCRKFEYVFVRADEIKGGFCAWGEKRDERER